MDEFGERCLNLKVNLFNSMRLLLIYNYIVVSIENIFSYVEGLGHNLIKNQGE